jgi:hypothetical protein
MALVPRTDSRQDAPVRSSTRCALVKKPWSPTVCSSMLSTSASTTMQSPPRIWPYMKSITGRAKDSICAFCSSDCDRLSPPAGSASSRPPKGGKPRVQAALPGARQAVVQRAGQAGTVVQQVPACQLQAVGRNTHGCLSPDRPAEGRHGGCRVPVRTGVQARGRWAVPVYRSGAAYEMPLLGCDVPNCPGLSRPLFHKVTLPRGQAKPQGCQLQGKPAPLAQVCQAGTACVSVPAADPPWAAAYLPLRRQDHGHV